jgi:DNA-binding XRE family transcriptional regulator
MSNASSELRHDLGFSQRRAADLLHVRRETVSNWESSPNPPAYYTAFLRTLAALRGLSPPSYRRHLDELLHPNRSNQQ